MKNQQVTTKEYNFLNQLADSCYSEWIDDPCGAVGDWIAPCDYDMKVVRGLISSLLQKDVITIDEVDVEEDGFGHSWVSIKKDFLDYENAELKNIKEVV